MIDSRALAPELEERRVAFPTPKVSALFLRVLAFEPPVKRKF